MHTHIKKLKKQSFHETTKTDRLGRETETPILPTKAIFAETETTFSFAIAVMMVLLSAQKNVLPQSGKTNVRRAAANYVFSLLIISQGVMPCQFRLAINWVISESHGEKDRQQKLPVFRSLLFCRMSDGTHASADQYSTSPVNTSLASPVRVTCSSV
jgi:hypothetical protein